MSPVQTVVRNLMLLTVSPLLRILVGIPLAGFVAHHLDVQGYGELNFALAFAALFGVAANLGLNEAFLRTAAREPAGVARLWSSAIATKWGLLVAYLAILVILSKVFGYSSWMVVLILLTGVYQGGMSLENTTLALFSARQQMKPVAAFGSTKFLVEVALTLSVLLAGASVLGLVAARAVLGLVGIVAAIVVARAVLGIRFAAPSARLMRPLMISGLSFAAMTTLWPIQARTGVLLLGHAHGLEAVALFSTAMMPVERLFLFLPVIQDAFYPMFSALGTDQSARFDSMLATSLRYHCLAAGGLGLGVSLAGPWALRLVFPSAFHGAGSIIEVLGIAVGLRVITVLLTTAALARGLERTMVRITVLQTIVAVGGAACMVGRFGALGLAYATVLTEATCLIALLAVLYHRGTLRTEHLTYLIGPAAASVVLFGIFSAVPSGRDSIVTTAAIAAAYPLFLLVSRALSRDDLSLLLAAVSRRSVSGTS